MKNTKPLIGFIGQGWIGKNYADNFEKRGYEIVRYSLEAPYNVNREKIAKCDIVFIAVPTPTTPTGFSDKILQKVLPLIGKNKIAVIKSTVIPGTTARLQKKFPDIILIHSPEFLVEQTARQNTDFPDRNIIGIPCDTKRHREGAKQVLEVKPKAPYELICSSEEAEFVKYAGNCYLYIKVIFANMLHDLSQKFPGVRYETIRDAITGDPRIGKTHWDPIHKTGRGAGGHCFIKDFAAFSDLYEKIMKDQHGNDVLRSIEKKNKHLLKISGKDLDLLRDVYGENDEILSKPSKIKKHMKI